MLMGYGGIRKALIYFIFTLCCFDIVHLQETDQLLRTHLSGSEAEHTLVEAGIQWKDATL